MTASAWATDLSDIILDPTSTTGWTALGGGASGLPTSGETDFYVQGTTTPSCMSKAAWTNAVKGFIYVGGPWTVPTTGVMIAWGYYAAPASLGAKSAGGLRIIIGSSATAYNYYYVGGNDTLIFESWVPYVVDPNTATYDGTPVGSPSGTEAGLGIIANLPSTAGPTKGNPLGMDALRYGRHTITYTYGDLANGYNTFALAEAYANALARRWGNIEYNKGVYLVQGFHSLGSSGTAVDFRDSNKVLFIRASGANNLTNDAVATGYNRFEIINASSNVDWDNIIIQALGSRARGVFVHTAGTFDATNCQFIDVDTFSLLSTSVMTDCTFRNTNAITAPGSDLSGSSVLTPTVAADASAVVWNANVEPDGLLDNMTFSKGTNAHHAIEFGTSSPTTMTLRGISFSGFNASNANNDSTLRFLRTTGTITVNLIGCSGNISYKKESGATVNFVIDPVSLSVHVQDINTGSAIYGARVWVPVTSTAGGKPYQASVSITRSGTTATVTHNSHGMATNDWIWIAGCTGADGAYYNGTFQITKVDDNSYTYTMSGTPTGSAAGSPIATFVVINTTTSVAGDCSASYSWVADQPVSGRARYAASPYYKTAPVAGTIDSTSGLAVTIQMIPDA